jgi:hypothetical protein
VVLDLNTYVETDIQGVCLSSRWRRIPKVELDALLVKVAGEEMDQLGGFIDAVED